LIAINEGINMRVILLSLMIVFLISYHANACTCVDVGDTYGYDCCRPLPNLCQGFAEIRSEFNGRERVHVRINKSTSSRSIQLEEGSSIYVEFDNEEDWAGRPLDGWITKASILKYRPTGGRNARKIIEVQGNCCWRFYQRFRYRGRVMTVRESGTVIPSFAPRSLKLVQC